jgi:hypothetical protein
MQLVAYSRMQRVRRLLEILDEKLEALAPTESRAGNATSGQGSSRSLKSKPPPIDNWQGFGIWRMRFSATLGPGLGFPVRGGSEEPV